MTERDRLNFIEARDGSAADFARRTLGIYRECLRQDGKKSRKFHHASLPQYRRSFILSCLEFRKYLRVV